MRRILSENGVLRISTPDLSKYAAAIAARDAIDDDRLDGFYDIMYGQMTRSAFGFGVAVPATAGGIFNTIMKNVVYDYHEHPRKHLYDFHELRYAAASAGWTPHAGCEVRRASFRESDFAADLAYFDEAHRESESLYVDMTCRRKKSSPTNFPSAPRPAGHRPEWWPNFQESSSYPHPFSNTSIGAWDGPSAGLEGVESGPVSSWGGIAGASLATVSRPIELKAPCNRVSGAFRINGDWGQVLYCLVGFPNARTLRDIFSLISIPVQQWPHSTGQCRFPYCGAKRGLGARFRTKSRRQLLALER